MIEIPLATRVHTIWEPEELNETWRTLLPEELREALTGQRARHVVPLLDMLAAGAPIMAARNGDGQDFKVIRALRALRDEIDAWLALADTPRAA